MKQQEYQNRAMTRCVILRNVYEQVDGKPAKLYVCQVTFSMYGSVGTTFKISPKYFPKDWKPYENTKRE